MRLVTVAIVALIVLLLGGGGALGAGAGSLDQSFGVHGRTTISFGWNGVEALAVQADGKLVAAGADGPGGSFALARFNRTGSLDTSFNGTGKLTTGFETGPSEAFALAVQPDGKLVAAGEANDRFGLARYNPDGSLDTTFNGTGKQTTEFVPEMTEARALAVQPDGKIVAAGGVFDGQYVFALARYNPDGSLDTSFNGTGKLTTAFGEDDDQAFALAVQPDGKIVAAGSTRAGYGNVFALARYNADGSLDTSFNGSGKQTTRIGGFDMASALAVQPDGKPVVAGQARDPSSARASFALARYNPDGSLDTSFNGTGTQTTRIGTADAGAQALALQPDGKLVAAGYSFIGSDSNFTLARYNPNGSLDTSFNGTGKQTTTFGGTGYDFAYAVALQPDGGIVAGGESSGSFALARYCGSDAFTVWPTHAAPDSKLLVSGAGFAPREPVDLYFDQTYGVLASSDGCGAIYASLPVPAATLFGDHFLTAVGRTSGHTAQASVKVADDWPMFGFDPAHTGANPSEQTLSPANASGLHLLWQRQLGGGGSQLTPASTAGVVYAVGADGRLYARDAASGDKLWQSPTAAPNTASAPAATTNFLFAGSTDKHLYALNTATGQPRWQTPKIGPITSPATLAGDTVYTATTDTLYAYDTATGSNTPGYTPYTAAGPIKGSPAVAGGSVYFATRAPDNKIIAIDAATGALDWQAGPFPGADFVSSPTLGKGHLYIGGLNHNLYALDTNTGKTLWTATTGGPIASSPATANGLVYAGSNDNKLYAYTTDTGAPKWNQPLGAPITGSPALANGILAITIPNLQKLVILDAATGKKLRTLDTRPNPSSPIIVNATVYLSTTTGLTAYSLTPTNTTQTPDPHTLTPDPGLQP